MKLISASRRTDIPAFYSKWFLNRIQAGFSHWINPYSGQVYRVSLQAKDCLAIAFWTRNPKPLIPYFDRLRDGGYYFYFHFTINGYPKAIESNNPPMEVSIETFRQASQMLSPELVHWRYDPILLSKVTPFVYHLEQFDFLSQQLAGYTHRCYFSFVDFYGKTQRNLQKVERQHDLTFQQPSVEEKYQLVQKLRSLAAPRGITLYSCCSGALVGEGIEKAHCIDLDLIQKLRPDVEFHLASAPTRQDCGCVKVDDIGMYDTCVFGCTYCYATNSRDAALKRMGNHTPEDTILWRPASLRGVDLATKEQKLKQSVMPIPQIIQGSLFE